MDLTAQRPAFSKKELKFKSRIEKIVAHQDLTLQRQLIARVAQDLNIDVIDCAAALVLLSQSNPYHPIVKKQSPQTQLDLQPEFQPKATLLRPIPPPKMIRYRIDVGQKHRTTVDEIRNVFIEEAGVDKKMIGKVEMRYHYTLIDLPEGMPSDIYRLLTSVAIQKQRLNIRKLYDKSSSS